MELRISKADGQKERQQTTTPCRKKRRRLLLLKTKENKISIGKENLATSVQYRVCLRFLTISGTIKRLQNLYMASGPFGIVKLNGPHSIHYCSH